MHPGLYARVTAHKHTHILVFGFLFFSSKTGFLMNHMQVKTWARNSAVLKQGPPSHFLVSPRSTEPRKEQGRQQELGGFPESNRYPLLWTYDQKNWPAQSTSVTCFPNRTKSWCWEPSTRYQGNWISVLGLSNNQTYKVTILNSPTPNPNLIHGNKETTAKAKLNN